MTKYALIYIVQNILAEVLEFFLHWYLGGFRAGSRWLISTLEQLDHFFAFRITFRYFGKPLFQDRTAVGYILGFIFRTLRLLLGGFVYLVVIVVAIGVYVTWAMIPAYIVYKIFNF